MLRQLPVCVTLVALLGYLATLSWSLTPQNLPLAAKVAGWDWRPMSNQPLLWLLTLPLRGLPAAWVPAGLSVFSALCGALMLGLLARSVELLPWERPWKADSVWSRKLPVVFACVACGLQYSFWQASNMATGETLDVLVLATGIWCVLEFSAGRNLRWLDAAALVWGLGMAQNWVMLVGFPFFVLALVWVQGLDFFKVRFLVRMAVLGLLGVSTYALLPMVNGLGPQSPWAFGEAWRMSLRTTWHSFADMPQRLWGERPYVLVAVVSCFLLPILPCVVRPGAQGTAYVPAAEQFEIWLYRLVRAAFLAGCLWLALDPTVGPQPLLLRETGLAMPLLTFDYFNGLGIGFLVGCLLLLFEPAPNPQASADFWWQHQRWVRYAAVSSLAVLCGGLALWLLTCNGPAVYAADQDALDGFGALAERSLPQSKGIILSDDPMKLLVVQAALAQHGRAGEWLAVDTTALPSPQYRGVLQQRHPAGWLTDASRHNLSPREMVGLLDQLVQNEPVYYLHPSFGYFFEQLQLQAHGAVYAVSRREGNHATQLPAAAMAANNQAREAAWHEEMEPLSALKAGAPARVSSLRAAVCARLHLSPAPARRARVLQQWYSAALDAWGVELQQQGNLPQARQRFAQALALNPNNYSARINSQCNTNLMVGRRLNPNQVGQTAAKLMKECRFDVLLRQYGPFDDPVLCLALGRSFQQSGLVRQAKEQVTRARVLLSSPSAYGFAPVSDGPQQMLGPALAGSPRTGSTSNN